MAFLQYLLGTLQSDSMLTLVSSVTTICIYFSEARSDQEAIVKVRYPGSPYTDWYDYVNYILATDGAMNHHIMYH